MKQVNLSGYVYLINKNTGEDLCDPYNGEHLGVVTNYDGACFQVTSIDELDEQLYNWSKDILVSPIATYDMDVDGYIQSTPDENISSKDIGLQNMITEVAEDQDLYEEDILIDLIFTLHDNDGNSMSPNQLINYFNN